MLTKKFKYFLLLKYKINLRKEENEMYSETKIIVRYAETDQMGIMLFGMSMPEQNLVKKWDFLIVKWKKKEL